MKKLYLVRHGQSTTNAGGEMKANAEIELTQLGHEQARGVAGWIQDTLGEDIISIRVSSYIRTQQTAQPLLDLMGVEPTCVDGLQEFNFLSLAKTKNVSFARRLEMVDEYWATQNPEEPHGEDAESFHHFYNRVARVLEQFKTLPEGNHVVFTHGFWISMVAWQLLGQPLGSAELMRKFRQFEKSIRAQNGEVLCLTLPSADLAADYLPSITKARSLTNQNSDLSA